ncbi:DNA binding protein [Arthrobacter phage EastWest]|uniref:DNA binding protein n=1 Tax=Arthrobacter phage EastWest TaxID=2894292 RepID=A0AAE8YLK1_9CAUD|nr:DNA binding protein [Arthrobacter phage EastWest]
MPRKMTPRMLDLAKRDERALQLFALGKTYQQIADAPWKGGRLFNGDKGNCYKRIQKLISEVTREPAEHARTTELLRLDLYLNSLAPRVLRGDVAAINTALKAADSRAKLLGLYENTKVEVTGPMQVVFSAALKSEAGMDAPEMEIDKP